MGVFDVDFVREHISPRDFPVCVETGTCLGYSTARIAQVFPTVYTIELNPELHRAAQHKFGNDPNIVCIEGESSEELGKLLPTLASPAVFYLDAHWSGDARVDWPGSAWQGYGVPTGHRRCDDGGELPSSREQVPLLEEIRTILHFPHACVIYVDDMDKFAPDGKGRTDKGFRGEDWSHLDWFAIVEMCRPRLKAEKYKGGEQAMLILHELAEAVEAA
jgi:hypothetical protein